MTIQEFKASLVADNPPSASSDYLKALWYDAKGNWNKSHQIVQDIETKTASRIHAYLHRKEGDIGNADYWYSRAASRRPDVSLQEEWEELCKRELSD